MPDDTLEVRWFFEGALRESAPEVEKWFLAEPPHPAWRTPQPMRWPEKWRTDCYFLVPGARDIGIKLREGRFEIKARVSDFGIWPFGARNAGRTERWMKWSYALGEPFKAGGKGWPPAVSVGVGIEKQRIVRRLNLDYGDLFEIAREDAAGAYVDCELARIRTRGLWAETHWSLAFEASPYRSDLHAPFARVLGDILETWPRDSLIADRSMSYPAWLFTTV